MSKSIQKIQMCEPLGVSKCKKCGKVIAETKELIRVRKQNDLTVWNGDRNHLKARMSVCGL